MIETLVDLLERCSKIYYLREISLMIQDERGRSSFRLIYFLSLLVSNTRGTAKTA